MGSSRWSIRSEDSILCIGCKGSLLSIGSVGSVLSIGCVGSALSVLSVGSFASAGSLLSAASRQAIMSWRSNRGVMVAGRPRPTATDFRRPARDRRRVLAGCQGPVAMSRISQGEAGPRRPTITNLSIGPVVSLAEGVLSTAS